MRRTRQAMYSFSVCTRGLASGQSPPAQSIRWTTDGGSLPAPRTSFTRDDVGIAIKNFADRAVVNGTPLVQLPPREAAMNPPTNPSGRRTRRRFIQNAGGSVAAGVAGLTAGGRLRPGPARAAARPDAGVSAFPFALSQVTRWTGPLSTPEPGIAP
jgi:hypothetical protein